MSKGFPYFAVRPDFAYGNNERDNWGGCRAATYQHPYANKDGETPRC
jgi:hypothetical protein